MVYGDIYYNIASRKCVLIFQLSDGKTNFEILKQNM